MLKKLTSCLFVSLTFLCVGCEQSSVQDAESDADSTESESASADSVKPNSKPNTYTPKIIVTQEGPGLMLITPKLAIEDGLFLTITFIIPTPEDSIKFNLGGLAGTVLIENHVETRNFGLKPSMKLNFANDNVSYQLTSPRVSDVNNLVTGLSFSKFRARELHDFLSEYGALTLALDGKRYELPPETRECLRMLALKTTDRLY